MPKVGCPGKVSDLVKRRSVDPGYDITQCGKQKSNNFLSFKITVDTCKTSQICFM